MARRATRAINWTLPLGATRLPCPDSAVCAVLPYKAYLPEGGRAKESVHILDFTSLTFRQADFF